MDKIREASFSEPDYLLDTASINARFAASSDNPRRIRTGVCKVPYDCVGGSLRAMLYDRASMFVEAMHKQGWELEGGLQMGNPRPAYDEFGLPDMSLREVTIQGIFKFVNKGEVIRLYLDPAAVRREPDQTLSARDALRAWGLN